MAVDYAWYGDDFTGASDTLATVAQAGLRALLFCGEPTADRLARAGELDALGIAGAARSMAPEAMRAELARVVPSLEQSGARVLHYKVCSTFDSAPHVGNIGVAVEALRPLARGTPVVIVGGQPSLGRYCVFGELYAVAHRGGPVYRIDRHPTMSRHPVTPMQEADLRAHLARQGWRDIGLVDVRAYGEQRLGIADRDVLFDVLDETHLASIGRVLWDRSRDTPLVAVGASSVAQSLIDHWGRARKAKAPGLAPARGPVLALAGSLSPATARQVMAATRYSRLPLAPDRMVNDRAYLLQQADGAAELLAAGHDVLAHTTPIGGQHAVTSAASELARACGALLCAVLRRTPVTRIGIAGGDTSSHAVQALDAWGLEWIAQVDAGVALLRAHADDARVDGVELMLKGGQMGADDLFERLAVR